jgi:hypothetical protein
MVSSDVRFFLPAFVQLFKKKYDQERENDRDSYTQQDTQDHGRGCRQPFHADTPLSKRTKLTPVHNRPE